MKRTPVIVFIYLTFYCGFLSAQQRGDFRILFYNVENLFDTEDNPYTEDDEFLPDSERRWNNYRLNNKLNNIAKVILASGGWESPDIVGLCEVENRKVVEQLLNNSSLKNQKYKVIHKESPDPRGIDVSMIYKEESFRPLKYEYNGLKNEDGEVRKTREILYVKGIVKESDTLHLFFNHWPSRYSGYLETVEFRKLAARTLRNRIDLILSDNPDAKVIIMGDFNDQPTDESLTSLLLAKSGTDASEQNTLINLSAGCETSNYGTIKYQSQWQIYDQVIVSKEILDTVQPIFSSPENAGVIHFDFLLTEDKKYGGLKPFRTYNGFSYEGGFSDHLPVYIDLFIR
ncbi:MAG: endonuclease/exonuclease/phosphatase family protein [Prolixibacteraceae bacterium]|nr:endonuclease/exonuclease/phosphatase family protein [Prolixibacteraceae bacterium]